MKWIEDNCPADDVRKTKQMALDAVGIAHFECSLNSRLWQMLAFKTADLQTHENLSAYTTALTHNLKSVTASARRFLGRNTNQASGPTHLTDGISFGGCDTVLDGLQLELDTYLHEPPMVPFKEAQDSGSGGNIVCCNPLQYWTVCIPPSTNL